MESCSTSLVIRKCKLDPLGCLQFKKTDNKCGEDMETSETLTHCWRECKKVQWKSLVVSQKVKQRVTT